MEACYEYLGCANKACIMCTLTAPLPCWKVEGTLCSHMGIHMLREELIGSKEEACLVFGCIYYQEAKARLQRDSYPADIKIQFQS